MAKQLGKKKIGVLAYNVDNSEKCADGVQKSFEKYPSAKVVFYSDSLSFGDTDFSVEVGQMKDEGVDFVTTCMDTNGVLNLAKEMRKQSLDAIQYLPNGYDQAFMKANGEFFEGSIVGVPFAPFETKPAAQGPRRVPDQWMDKARATRRTRTRRYGWINAAMLVRGTQGGGAELHPPEGRRRAQQDDGRHRRRPDPADRLDDRAHRDSTHAARLHRVREGRRTASSSRPSAEAGKPFLCLPDQAATLPARSRRPSDVARRLGRRPEPP